MELIWMNYAPIVLKGIFADCRTLKGLADGAYGNCKSAIIMLDAVIQMLSKQQRKHARRLSASQRISLQAPA
jgi:hypothetical protein